MHASDAMPAEMQAAGGFGSSSLSVKAFARAVRSHPSTYDGRDDRGRRASSGVYLCRLSAGGQVIVRRMALAR